MLQYVTWQTPILLSVPSLPVIPSFSAPYLYSKLPINTIWILAVNLYVYQQFLIPFHNEASFYVEELLAPRQMPKLEDHLLSAVRECLFSIFAATLDIGGRSSIRNPRTRRAMVTGTNLLWVSFWHSSFLLCAHRVCLCVLYGCEDEQRLFSLYSINWLVFVTEMRLLYLPVQIAYLNVIQVNRSLQTLNPVTKIYCYCVHNTEVIVIYRSRYILAGIVVQATGRRTEESCFVSRQAQDT